MNITIFTQSAIKMTNNDKTIYFDSFKIKEPYHDADYIFITHDHYDHYDEESLKNIITDKTILVVPPILQSRAMKLTPNIMVVEPNKTYELSSFKFTTVPAYNITKKFHPKEANYVGYNLLIDGTYYYIMGDTDRTPEADAVKTDVCFVPIGGTYTMDLAEAVAYINDLKPKKAIPIHYGSIVGDISLKDDFQKLVSKDIAVEIYLK